MIEIEAKVVRVQSGIAWITQKSKGLCQYCNAETGCKAIALSRLFCRQSRVFRVRDPWGVTVGEDVRVGVMEKNLLQGAIMAYFFPVLSLIVGALLGKYWDAEYGSILGGMIGFGGALYVLSKKNIKQDHLPIILSRIEIDSQVVTLNQFKKKEK